MSEVVNFFRGIVYLFAAASFIFFLVWFLRYWLPRRNEPLEEGFHEKKRIASAYLDAAGKTDIPWSLEDMVAEALDNHESYLERETDIFDKAHEKLFGFGNYMHTGHRHMAEFAKRHLRDHSIVKHWDTERIVHYSRWACQREYVILQIIRLLQSHPQAIFATDMGRTRSGKIAAKLKDFRAIAGDARKNFRRERAGILVDRGLTDEEKSLQIRDLDNLAEEELKKLRRDMGITDQFGGESVFQKKLMSQVKMLGSTQKAIAALKKRMAEEPENAEAIEELIDDIESGDWENWGD